MAFLPVKANWIEMYYHSKVFHHLSLIIALSGLIILPILFILHCYRKICCNNPLFRLNGNDSFSRKERMHFKDDWKILYMRNLLTILPVITVILSIIASIIALFNTQHIIRRDLSNWCLFMAKLQNICWLIPKMSIYLVSILRLYISFYGSIYQYSGYIMLGLYSICSCVGVTLITGTLLDGEVKGEYKYGDYCDPVIPNWLKISPMVMDIIIGSLYLILFTKPMRSLIKRHIKAQKKSRYNRSALRMARLITKLVVLTCITIITNIIAGTLFLVYNITLANYLDTIINSTCLILMESVHKDLYKISCYCCHIICHKCLNCNNKTIRDEPWDKHKNVCCFNDDITSSIKEPKKRKNSVTNTENMKIIESDKITLIHTDIIMEEGIQLQTNEHQI
mmetsp:Transcript_53666/g.65788  ORF Transcript_53666/g.65788 Transcript_53666/m.65788 type:complete len:394 (+) Transcript_53666:41-1222(+)